MARVFVYIDGLNLYHDLVRRMDERGKWLDFEALVDTLAEKRVDRIHYFTSRVKALRGDDSPQRRQATYLRVVENMQRVTVSYGKVKVERVRRFLFRPLLWERRFPRVLNPKEKGSDVALASQLLGDAFARRFDTALAITNDSDLVPPFRMVRDLGLDLKIFHPSDAPAGAFVKAQLTTAQLPVATVLACGLPNPAPTRTGYVHCPPEWEYQP